MLKLGVSSWSSKYSSSWPLLQKESLVLIKSFSCKQRYHWGKEQNYIRVAQMEKLPQKSPEVPDNSGDLRCAIITGVSKPYGIGRCLVHNFLEQEHIQERDDCHLHQVLISLLLYVAGNVGQGGVSVQKRGYKVAGLDIKSLENETMEAQSDLQITSASKLPLDRFHFVHADISDPEKIKLAVKEAVEWLGGCIHVLINNAARTKTIMDDEDPMKAFAETIAVNLNGVYYLSEAVLPCMPPGLSSIINISSTRALQSEPNTAAYSASKAGLCGLTHSQAITLAGRVRVNAVLPGWINTDPAGEAALRDEDHKWHPVGRVGTPQDIAEMCLFLADEKRSGFITGQEFVVDGGVTKKMVYPE